MLRQIEIKTQKKFKEFEPFWKNCDFGRTILENWNPRVSINRALSQKTELQLQSFIFQLNLIVAGTSEKLTVMLEGEAANLDKNLFLEGIRVGLDSCAEIASRIRQGKTGIGGIEERETNR